MATSCIARCAKFTLFAFNFIFFMSGAVLVCVGIWLRFDKSMLEVTGDTYFMMTEAYTFIGLGIFVFVVGFFGCCGAIRESKCLLGVYIFLLFVVMGIAITAGVFSFFYREEVRFEWAYELMDDQYYNSTTGKYYPFGQTVNFVQKEFACCGANAPSDYEESTFQRNNPQLVIPYSCCQMKDDVQFTEDSPAEKDVKDWKACQADYPDGKDGHLHKDGCMKRVTDWVNPRMIMLYVLAFCVATLAMSGIFFAVFTCVCLCINPEE